MVHPIAHVYDVIFPWVDTHHYPILDVDLLTILDIIDVLRVGSLSRNAVGGATGRTFLPENKRYAHPIGLHHVVKIIPFLPEDTLVQLEQLAPEPLLFCCYILLQIAFGDLHAKVAIDLTFGQLDFCCPIYNRHFSYFIT